MLRSALFIALLAVCALDRAPAADDPQQALAALCRRLGTEMTAADRFWTAGEDGFLFLLGEIRHAGAGPFWGDAAQQASQSRREPFRDPLPVIIDTHRQLAAMGIELVLAPVPNRPQVYPDRLPGSDLEPVAGSDRHHQDFIAALRQADIAVVDLLPALRAGRAEDAGQGPVSCRADTHWSPRGAAIAAAAIAAAIADRPWLQALEREDFITMEHELTVIGDLARMAGQEQGETLPLVTVLGADAAPLRPDPASPILLLADSHGLVFETGGDMFAEASGVAAHLALNLGRRIDVLARRGDAITTIRRDLSDRFYDDHAWRAGKRLIVWCFAERQYTETAGWMPIRLDE